MLVAVTSYSYPFKKPRLRTIVRSVGHKTPQQNTTKPALASEPSRGAYPPRRPRFPDLSGPGQTRLHVVKQAVWMWSADIYHCTKTKRFHAKRTSTRAHTELIMSNGLCLASGGVVTFRTELAAAEPTKSWHPSLNTDASSTLAKQRLQRQAPGTLLQSSSRDRSNSSRWGVL